MKARLGIMVLLVALASCGSSAASSGTATSGTSPGTTSGSRHCGPSGASTTASSSQARVYTWKGAVFGCSFARGRSFHLGGAARSIRESTVALAAVGGTNAAYSLSDFGVDTVRADVIVRRLTDGRTLSDLPATARNVAEGFQSVGSLVVKTDGSAAWIGSVHSIVGHRSLIEVHAAAAPSFADRVLDSGPGIDPPSLRLHGSTLTWTNGASTRRATLR